MPSRVEITALVVIIGAVIMVLVLARALLINARTLLRDRNRSLDGFRAGLERQANKMLEGLLHPDDPSPPDRGRSG